MRRRISPEFSPPFPLLRKMRRQILRKETEQRISYPAQSHCNASGRFTSSPTISPSSSNVRYISDRAYAPTDPGSVSTPITRSKDVSSYTAPVALKQKMSPLTQTHYHPSGPLPPSRSEMSVGLNALLHCCNPRVRDRNSWPLLRITPPQQTKHAAHDYTDTETDAEDITTQYCHHI